MRNGEKLRKPMSILNLKEKQVLLNRSRIRYISLSTTFILLIALALFSIRTGVVSIGIRDILLAVKVGITGGESSLSPGRFSIIWDIRIPRIVMALICGSALSVGGVGMQGVLRNPLVSPYTLGISSAAAFGASLAIVFLSANAIIPLAFISSLAAVSFVLGLANIKGLKSESLILSGIAVMYVFSSGASLLQYLATKDQLSQIVFWLMGSLSSTTWNQVFIAGFALLVLYPVLYGLSWHLNILSSGEDSAKSLGTHPGRIMFLLIITVTLLTSIIVSFTGVIGFVGLAAPHIARLVFGTDHRILFPSAALTGAFILTLADTLARTILGNTEIPIGIITSLIGVPFLISILLKRERSRKI